MTNDKWPLSQRDDKTSLSEESNRSRRSLETQLLFHDLFLWRWLLFLHETHFISSEDWRHLPCFQKGLDIAIPFGLNVTKLILSRLWQNAFIWKYRVVLHNVRPFYCPYNCLTHSRTNSWEEPDLDKWITILTEEKSSLCLYWTYIWAPCIPIDQNWNIRYIYYFICCCCFLCLLFFMSRQFKQKEEEKKKKDSA